MLFFLLWNKKKSKKDSPMKKVSSMNEEGHNLSESSFGCCFCCSFVGFKNSTIIVFETWVINALWKSWRSIVLKWERLRNDS